MPQRINQRLPLALRDILAKGIAERDIKSWTLRSSAGEPTVLMIELLLEAVGDTGWRRWADVHAPRIADCGRTDAHLGHGLCAGLCHKEGCVRAVHDGPHDVSRETPARCVVSYGWWWITRDDEDGGRGASRPVGHCAAHGFFPRPLGLDSPPCPFSPPGPDPQLSERDGNDA